MIDKILALSLGIVAGIVFYFAYERISERLARAAYRPYYAWMHRRNYNV